MAADDEATTAVGRISDSASAEYVARDIQVALDDVPAGYKRTEAGIIPMDWDIKSVQQIGSVVTGGTPSTNNPKFWHGTLPWITPTDISEKKEVLSSERLISKNGISVIRELPADTVLVRLLSTRLSQKGMTAASKTASIQAPTPIPKGFVHGGNHPSEDSWPSWPVRQVRGLGRRQPVAGLSLPPRSPFCGCVAPRRSALHGQSVAATAGTGFAPMRVSRDA